MTAVPVSEGFFPFHGYQSFYRVVGDLAMVPTGMSPMLAIHGVPPSHEALEPLEGLAQSGRPIIFYDQLGCGRSDRPDDPALWTISLFVDEVEAIRRALQLEQVHLLGHSWGGLVAMEYALRQPNGLVSLTLASTFQSRSMLDAERARQRNELPAEVLETLRVHEAAGTTDDPAYKQATRVYDLTYICRIDPWPECLDRALRHMPVGYADDDGWDIQPRLGEIQVPTLVTCGRYDGCPACAQIIHRGIPNSEFVLFEESSHYAHIEETERYLAVVDDFLTRVERQRGAQL